MNEHAIYSIASPATLVRLVLVILWELQLFFFEQQIKYLLCFGYVEAEALHKPLLFDSFARDGVCPLSPLCHGHFLFLARVIRFIRLGHVHMVLELVLVQLRMVKFIRRKLLHQVRQRCELQLESHILDWLSES